MAIEVRFLKDGETMFGKGAFAPMFVCDMCGDPITKMGNYFFDMMRKDGSGQRIVMAHKGRCSNQAEGLVEFSSDAPGWDEMKDLLVYLNANFTYEFGVTDHE